MFISFKNFQVTKQIEIGLKLIIISIVFNKLINKFQNNFFYFLRVVILSLKTGT